MNKKQSISTICTHSSTGTVEGTKDYIQKYRIKVSDLPNDIALNRNERSIYLNITFADQNQTTLQTQCIDIRRNNSFFEIKTRTGLQKIEVIDYDSLKKMSKISLRGIEKEFKHSHLEAKHQIQVIIERSHEKLQFLQRKCKMANQIYFGEALQHCGSNLPAQNTLPDQSFCLNQ